MFELIDDHTPLERVRHINLYDDYDDVSCGVETASAAANAVFGAIIDDHGLMEGDAQQEEEG